MHYRITNLKTNDGRLPESHKDMETDLVAYFEDILTKNE